MACAAELGPNGQQQVGQVSDFKCKSLGRSLSMWNDHQLDVGGGTVLCVAARYRCAQTILGASTLKLECRYLVPVCKPVGLHSQTNCYSWSSRVAFFSILWSFGNLIRILFSGQVRSSRRRSSSALILIMIARWVLRSKLWRNIVSMAHCDGRCDALLR